MDQERFLQTFALWSIKFSSEGQVSCWTLNKGLFKQELSNVIIKAQQNWYFPLIFVWINNSLIIEFLSKIRVKLCISDTFKFEFFSSFSNTLGWFRLKNIHYFKHFISCRTRRKYLFPCFDATGTSMLHCHGGWSPPQSIWEPP